MRRLLPIAGAAVLVMAGCGGGAGERAASVPTPPSPTHVTGPPPRPPAPPRKRPSPAVAQALASGSVGVVGTQGAIGVRPRAIDVAADAALEDITWKAWDAQGAEGSGQLRKRDCDPTCASGNVDHVAATIRLSRPRVCGRSSYFDRAVVRVATGPQPQTYVRAPC
jgi:hypothetical protein